MPYFVDIYDPDDPSGEPIEIKGPIAKPETAGDVGLRLEAQGKVVRIREEPFQPLPAPTPPVAVPGDDPSTELEEATVPEQTTLTILISNARASVTEVGGEPILLRAFMADEEWQDTAENLLDALAALGDLELRFLGAGVSPSSIHPDDVDAVRSARSLCVLVSFRGDRRAEVRAAVQMALNANGIAECETFWNDPQEYEIVRGADLLISDLAGLFQAEGCDSREDLDEQLSDNSARQAHIDWRASDAAGITVEVRERSERIAFPFTIGTFWATVVRLDESFKPLEESSACRPGWRHAAVCDAGGMPCNCGCSADQAWCAETARCPICGHLYRYHLDGSCWSNDNCTCSETGRLTRSPDRYLAELDSTTMINNWSSPAS